MEEHTTRYGVWDTKFEDWDSGPYLTKEDAERYTYIPAIPEGADKTKHKPSKTLVVREWS